MPKHRETRKQSNDRRIREQREAAELQRLLAATGRHRPAPARTGHRQPKSQAFGLDYSKRGIVDSAKQYPSADEVFGIRADLPKPKPVVNWASDQAEDELHQHMAEREALAQEEIARKKTMVAPMYNKGGYQYIGETDPKTIGARKI